MTEQMQKRILRELYAYPQNKDMSRVIQDYLQVNKDLFMTLAIVNSIESALAELLPEIRRYTDVRYFSKNYCTLPGLAMQFNVSERTIQRWDRILLETIAAYFMTIDWQFSKED